MKFIISKKGKCIFMTFMLLYISSTNICAQTTTQWEDPYLKPDAPGYEDVIEAQQYYQLNDRVNAYNCYIKAAKKGNLHGHYISAYLTMEASGATKKDTIDAVKNIGYCAQQGYAVAQYGMAYLLREGIGIAQNKYMSNEYLKASADQNYIPAKIYLASCYLLGKDGFTKDEKLGIKMTEECANAGDADSQHIMGSYYYGITGNTPDYNKAIKWFQLAADNGQYQACNQLAYMYAKGEGTEKDFRKAHALIQEAINKAEWSGQLNRDVEANLLDSDGEIYMIEGKNEEAIFIWKQMKEKYPEYVEYQKFNIENVFVRTMYKQEQEAHKPQMASNHNVKPTVPVVISDIDEKIPENTVVGNPTFAVIIANENYKDVEGVPYANHDGETFKQYCEKTLGIPKNNIKYVADATLNNIRRELNWLGQVMDVYQGEANIIFYYAGHGIPNESNGSAYLLPVDGVGNDVSTGYSLDKLYADLSSKPAKSVVVLLDACFSGAKRNGGMIASARGVTIKAKQNAPKGNMVVLSAAQGDETAYPYKEKGHGMFTYYLLKKLQETKGNVSFGDLADYVTAEVKKQSIVVNGKMQTPLVSPSSVATDWRNWKLR